MTTCPGFVWQLAGTLVEFQTSSFHLEYFRTDSGVDFKCLRVKAAATALTLDQVPRAGSHPQATSWDTVHVFTWPGLLSWRPGLTHSILQQYFILHECHTLCVHNFGVGSKCFLEIWG